MLWYKALHLIFMVTWFAGLFYLPRLFVYHSMSTDQPSIARFKLMERRLFYGIMTPGAILTLIFGAGILLTGEQHYYRTALWLYAKLILLALLLVYHGYCGRLLHDFKRDINHHSTRWYRLFNEVPVVFLVTIVLLAVLRPF